jgi:hypothetical protein
MSSLPDDQGYIIRSFSYRWMPVQDISADRVWLIIEEAPELP